MSTVRVVIIDNDAAIREFLRIGLSDEGYTVYAVPGGQPGLDMLATVQPDLIILDLNVGITEVSHLVASYQRVVSHPIPIVALSTSDTIARIAGTLNVAAFLAKPFNWDELLHIVNQTRPRFLH